MNREQIDRLAMLLDPDTKFSPTSDELRVASRTILSQHRFCEVMRDKCAAMEAGLKGLSKRLDEQRPGICEDHGPYLRACPECAVGIREAALKAGLSREELAHSATIDERDEAENAISRIHWVVTNETPRWSNNYGYADAEERIDTVVTALRADNARLREALEGVKLTDRTPYYELHEPRPDGMVPRDGMDQGVCWLTPREIAQRALADTEGSK